MINPFYETGTIGAGDKPPAWSVLTRTVADAVESSHGVEVLEDGENLLRILLTRTHVLGAPLLGPQPMLDIWLDTDRTTVRYRIIWRDYWRLIPLAILLGLAAGLIEGFSFYIPLLLFGIALILFFDNRRTATRLREALDMRPE
ncbi:MAG: hypothetical protein IH600_01150 [Bacteroidetes bacterium]|nr:hypothetical protein [Bacteroidota bacterium]